MDRVSTNPAKTQHPTILERPKPEPDCETPTNPEGFFRDRNQQFWCKKPTFLDKNNINFFRYIYLNFFYWNILQKLKEKLS